jgi:hypothetical protein
MKTTHIALSVAAIVLFSFLVVPSVAVRATTCTTVLAVNPDHSTFTAAVVATSGATITGDIDASGCNVGVFVPNTVSDVRISATIHDANQYGVFADGGSFGQTNATNVFVMDSIIYNIGNHNSSGAFSPNGVQTGVGIYFSNGATGSIIGNTISNYQKGGIVVFDFTGSVKDNIVTGLGPVNFIAQNGIQLGLPEQGYYFPASNAVNVEGNIVTGNIYTQGYTAGGHPFVSTGILVFASSGSAGELQSSIHITNEVSQNQADVVVSVA